MKSHTDSVFSIGIAVFAVAHSQRASKHLHSHMVLGTEMYSDDGGRGTGVFMYVCMYICIYV